MKKSEHAQEDSGDIEGVSPIYKRRRAISAGMQAGSPKGNRGASTGVVAVENEVCCMNPDHWQGWKFICMGQHGVFSVASLNDRFLRAVLVCKSQCAPGKRS